ncbi:MAG: hypothetical protein JWM32_1307 [Verrucomicrobia bacterium]|nr:hypothetical protein [Verrucomicrobiota bacterium]
MKWIVVAILVSIVAYTYLTLHYRRPGKAFSPYSDLKSRANTKRLLSAGYQRIVLDAGLPADATLKPSDATIALTPAGLPATLRDSLIEIPQLPAEIAEVYAAASVNSMFAYPIDFRCTLPDNKQQLAGAELYVRDEEIIVTPDFDRLSGALLSRTRENLVRITVPAGSLKPGRYRVTLVGARASKAWTLQVH